MMTVTDAPSKISIRMVENVMSLYARNQAITTQIRKSVIDGCDRYPVAPACVSSLDAKCVNPRHPGDADENIGPDQAPTPIPLPK